MPSPALRYLLGGGAAEVDARSVSVEGPVAGAAPGAPAAPVPSVWPPPLLPVSSAAPLAGSSCAVSAALSAVTPTAMSSAARLEGSDGKERNHVKPKKKRERRKKKKRRN